MNENYDNIWEELGQQKEQTELKPEQKSDLILAAQLNELVGDYDNAAALYKQAKETRTAEQSRVGRDPPYRPATLILSRYQRLPAAFSIFAGW